MYLKKVSIKNYKGVKDIELELLPGVNLLIGDNGVGKTSVLEASAVALSGMLKGIYGVSTKNILQTDIHFTVNEKGDASTMIQYWKPTEIACTLQTEEREFSWKQYREDNNGKSRVKNKDDGIVKWMEDKSNELETVLPLLCFQSDARVWQMRKGDFRKELKKKLNDRRCGYIGCLDYSLDIKGIQEWCLKMELNEYQKKHKIQEYEAFKKIVATFMQKISDLDFMPEIYYSSQLGQIVYREGDMIMPVTNMSAGYQSLLWMVMNLAYRMALLNPENVCNTDEIPGIVLIDEIDMHLHPKWQWNIIKALEETFPKVQFILATHSPIVISSCKNEQLIMITEEQEVLYLDDAYGYSVQDVLNYRQGSMEKPKEMKVLTSNFENAMEAEDWNAVENIILEMEKLLGEDHPDVRSAKAELELNRWEAE